jgi:hypothetical protein
MASCFVYLLSAFTCSIESQTHLGPCVKGLIPTHYKASSLLYHDLPFYLIHSTRLTASTKRHHELKDHG